jgi:uncharacterized protein
VSPLEAVAVFAAGVAAGGINAVVGSGSLITFPTLLAVGVPPVLANISNTVGLVPGAVAGAFGYRRELAGQRGRLLRLGSASLLGAVAGGLLLLRLPPEAFQVIVPVLIVGACVLVLAQPRLNARLAARRTAPPRPHGGAALWLGVAGAGVYGGYFGAAQGVILIGLLGVGLDENLHRVNAAKNLLAGAVNGAAALLFIAIARVDWAAAGLIAAGSVIGGLLGGAYGRRLPPTALRVIIVIVGVVAAVKLVLD